MTTPAPAGTASAVTNNWRPGRRWLPPLRLPRALLDPSLTELPAGNGEGLVRVRLAIDAGRIDAIEASPEGPGQAGAPLAITPPVDAHVHLDKAFSWSAFPNQSATMAAALAANGREAEQRTADQVLQRGEAALDRAWPCSPAWSSARAVACP